MELKIKNVCCIGAGFVGGPTMAVMSKFCKENGYDGILLSDSAEILNLEEI